MGNPFSETLHQYYQNPNQLLFDQIQNYLWDELIEAIKGIKRVTCALTYQRFTFSYNSKGPNFDEIPDSVIWNGEERDFGDALEAIFVDLSRKIQKRTHLEALLKEQIDRCRWIRSTLGLVLTNKVFNHSISRYQSEKRKIRKFISHAVQQSNGQFKQFLADIESLAGPRFVEACEQKLERAVIHRWFDWQCFEMGNNAGRSLCEDHDQIKVLAQVPKKMATFLMAELNLPLNEIPLEQEALHLESRTILRQDDRQACEHFWAKSNMMLREQIESKRENQEHAFFWVPGQPLNEKLPEDVFHLFPVYIGFFYSWLRRCSKATNVAISREIGVSVSAVTRDWKPDDDLGIHFTETSFNINDGIYPVVFSNTTLRQLGLKERKIRCYKKRVYKGEDYNEILARKQALWTVYELMVNPDLADFIFISVSEKPETGAGFLKKLNLDFEIVSSEEAGLDDNPQNLLIRINSIGKIANFLFFKKTNATNDLANTLEGMKLGSGRCFELRLSPVDEIGSFYGS